LKILLVDDEPTVRDVLSEWLQDDGHSVQTAEDGMCGLEMFKTGAWDLIITDRVMPKLDGDAFAKAVKKLDQNVPIILITAFADRPPRVYAGRSSQFDMIIRKPFPHETLRAAIAAFAKATY
jgi:CheY-like chemotaxis protein